MDEHHRIPFVMREVEDLSYEEIADLIGIPVGTVKSRLARAKAHASLMFHTGASIAGDFPSLQGGEAVSRFMKFASLDEVTAKAPELQRLVRAWCDQRDAG